MKSREQIDFIRHGQSEHNLIPGILGGRTPEIELSERGKQEANQLSVDYPELRPHTLLMSSPARRAIETAQLGFPGREPITDGRILEVSRGEHEGMFKQDVYTPEFVEELERLGLDHKSPGGESLNDGADRMIEFIDDIGEKNSSAVVVGHSRAIKGLTARLLGLTYHETESGLKIPNASVTRVENNGRGWKIAFAGKPAHEVIAHDRKS